MFIHFKKAIVITVAIFVFLGSTVAKTEVVKAEPYQFTPTADPVKYGLILTLISEGLIYTSQKSSEAFQAMAEDLQKRLSAIEIEQIYQQVMKGYITVTSNIENQAKQLLVDWGAVHMPGEIVNYKAAGLVEMEDFRLGNSAHLLINNGSFVVIRFPIPDYGLLDPYNPYSSAVRMSEDIWGTVWRNYIAVSYYASSLDKQYVQNLEFYSKKPEVEGFSINYNSYGNTIYIQTSNNYNVNGIDVIDIKITDSYGLDYKTTYPYETSYREFTISLESYSDVDFRPTVYYRDNDLKQYIYDPADYSYEPRTDSLAGKSISVPVGADGVAIPIDNLYSYPLDQIGTVPAEGEGTGDLTGIAAGVNTLVGAITGFFDLTKPVNWEPMKAVGTVVTNKFPFSLPWDVARGIQGLEATMERPKIEGDWQMPWGDNVKVKIEVPQWMDPIFSMIRGGVVVLFVASLIFAHGRLMGGQK